MKKIFALILTTTLLISTVACSTGTELSNTLASQTKSTETIVSTQTTNPPSEKASTLGIPSWVFSKSASENLTSSMLITLSDGSVYGFPLNGSSTEQILLAEADDVYQYGGPMIYGEEVYALKSPVTGQGNSQFVSVYCPEGSTPTFKDITFTSNDISLPVLIGENLYYTNLATASIQKTDLKTGAETVIYTDNTNFLGSFTYDENYLYFQLVNSSGNKTEMDESLKTLYRIDLKNPTNAETWTMDKPYYINFVDNGKIYLYQWATSGYDNAPAAFVPIDSSKATWNSTITPLFPSPKEEQEVLDFQPYEDGYLVSSMNQKGSIYYFSFYDQDGSYVKDLLDPVNVQTGEYSAFPTVNSLEHILVYTNQINYIKTGKSETSTTLIFLDKTKLLIPPLPETILESPSSIEGFIESNGELVPETPPSTNTPPVTG